MAKAQDKPVKAYWFKWRSDRHASLLQEAQCAFKDSMIHNVLRFTLHFALRCVLHRCKSQEIHCWKLYEYFAHNWATFSLYKINIKGLYEDKATIPFQSHLLWILHAYIYAYAKTHTHSCPILLLDNQYSPQSWSIYDRVITSNTYAKSQSRLTCRNKLCL